VFDKFRKPPGGVDGSDASQSGRIRTGQSGPRRPARARPLSGAPGKDLTGKDLGRSRGPGPVGLSGGTSAARPEIAQVEQPCPNCGEPMLPGWGTTCGKCRPNLVAAKTMFLSADQVALPSQAAGSMTLGWLAVIRSPEESKVATLIELDRDRIVLSRAGAAPSGSIRVVQFDDSFMSSAHALIGRPASGDRNDAFTIRDRDNPGPSANGTFVNGQKLAPNETVRLADGDVVKVGSTELLFKSLWLPPVAARGR